MNGFSWTRFVAVLAKEFVQMRRDRVTFAMMVGVPIMQLILFGFAINSDPKNLPTAVLDADPSVFSRSFIRGDGELGLFPGDEGRELGRRGQPAARDRTGPVPGDGAAGLRAQAPARRAAGAAGRGRRVRPGGDVERADRAPQPQPDARSTTTCAARWRTSRTARRRSSCACSGATTRRASPSTTSCRD